MRDRSAAETPEERETRLQQMRLAVEIHEERETRLQRYRARYTENSLCSYSSHCFMQYPTFTALFATPITEVSLTLAPTMHAMHSPSNII